ncbi:MAG: hypothetical protein CO108_25425 [Deltaproteobacteria bacterium CG_4_9_14_3_um_filter_63_12]|nr:MAG: hypothetical protein CO108_25425 [Deltaproteobacteria bacterium CG_4_9_14_3_um_filter_63_12]
MKKRLGTIAVNLFVLGVLVFAAVRLWPHSDADTAHDEPGECSLNTSPCSKNVDGLEVRLDLTPRPIKPYVPLQFEVTLDGGRVDVDGIEIDLNMPAMNMGKNVVSLKAGPRSYLGTGTVTACGSGGTLWRAKVLVPGHGETEFLFDLVR